MKTSRENLFYVPESIDSDVSPYVFVHVRKASNPGYFVVPASEVARISHEEREAYLRNRPHVKRVQPRMIIIRALEPFEEQWQSIWQ